MVELWRHVEAKDCRRVWAAVLVQSVRDAFRPRYSGRFRSKDGRQQRQALDWLTSADCAEVVALAGYEPSAIMPRLADMVRRHEAGEAVLAPDRWDRRAG